MIFLIISLYIPQLSLCKKKVTRDSMYIFRNELELVCQVIGGGGSQTIYLGWEGA